MFSGWVSIRSRAWKNDSSESKPYPSLGNMPCGHIVWGILDAVIKGIIFLLFTRSLIRVAQCLMVCLAGALQGFRTGLCQHCCLFLFKLHARCWTGNLWMHSMGSLLLPLAVSTAEGVLLTPCPACEFFRNMWLATGNRRYNVDKKGLCLSQLGSSCILYWWFKVYWDDVCGFIAEFGKTLQILESQLGDLRNHSPSIFLKWNPWMLRKVYITYNIKDYTFSQWLKWNQSQI